MWAMHYTPHWLALTGRKISDPVRLILNYVLGSIGWFLLYALSLVFDGYIYLAMRGVLFLTAAGVTVTFLYALDYAVDERREMKNKLERSELERKQHDVPDKRT